VDLTVFVGDLRRWQLNLDSGNSAAFMYSSPVDGITAPTVIFRVATLLKVFFSDRLVL
jgi:hypothetical protein